MSASGACAAGRSSRDPAWRAAPAAGAGAGMTPTHDKTAGGRWGQRKQVCADQQRPPAGWFGPYHRPSTPGRPLRRAEEVLANSRNHDRIVREAHGGRGQKAIHGMPEQGDGHVPMLVQICAGGVGDRLCLVACFVGQYRSDGPGRSAGRPGIGRHVLLRVQRPRQQDRTKERTGSSELNLQSC